MNYQFHNEPLRIMMAAFGSGVRPTDAFVAATFQKYLHREMRLFDAAANAPESLVWSQMNKRFSLNAIEREEIEEEEEEQKPSTATGRKKKQCPRLPDIAQKPNPAIVALYGQMCLVTRSFQSAICACALLPKDHAINSIQSTCSWRMTIVKKIL